MVIFLIFPIFPVKIMIFHIVIFKLPAGNPITSPPYPHDIPMIFPIPKVVVVTRRLRRRNPGDLEALRERAAQRGRVHLSGPPIC